MDTIKIGVVGDYQEHKETHRATGPAVGHSARSRGWRAEVTWIATSRIEGAAERILAGFDALVIAPGSPYQSMRGALEAITHARTRDVPLLGTCAGFQHVVLEFARNVAGIPDAQHAEENPGAPRPLIDALACTLAGQVMNVTVLEGSLARRAYGAGGATERYYCNFGLNPEYTDVLTRGGLRVSGVDRDGEIRIVELPGHRFFMATLFVPQTSSAPGAPHPLVTALLEATTPVQDRGRAASSSAATVS